MSQMGSVEEGGSRLYRRMGWMQIFGFVFSLVSIIIDQSYRQLKMETLLLGVVAGGPYLLLMFTRRSIRHASPGVVKAHMALVILYLIVTVLVHLMGLTGGGRAWGFSWIPAIVAIQVQYLIALILALLASIVLIIRRINKGRAAH